jgi:hypothetical protein
MAVAIFRSWNVGERSCMPEMTVEDAEAEVRITLSVAIYMLERKAYGPDITASSYQWFQ